MSFFGLGPGEVLLIMLLALIVFGPRKLPEIGAGLGKAIREFQRASAEITQEFTKEIQVETPVQEPRRAEGPIVVETPQPSPAETTRIVMEQRDAAATMAVEHHQAEAASVAEPEVAAAVQAVNPLSVAETPRPETASTVKDEPSSSAEAATVEVVEGARPARSRRRRVTAPSAAAEAVSAAVELAAAVSDGPQEPGPGTVAKPPARKRRVAHRPEEAVAVAAADNALSQEV